MNIIEQIRDFIHRNQRFVITSHVRPDGDSLGTSLALALALRQMGKTAEVVHRDPPPQTYLFLPQLDQIRIASCIDEPYDAVIILECENYRRTGLQDLERFFTINIDHHPKNDFYGNQNWVDEGAAAVAELIYQLILSLDLKITPEIATNLYTAILTDTGSFQFSGTTSRTFETAGALVKAGVDPGRIGRQVYMSRPLSRVRLLARLLNTLELHSSGKIAWIYMDRSMLEETGAAANDVEGVANYALSIEGVVAAAFFRQEGDFHFRISLRSKNTVNVGSVAARFGGGGHVNAAGLSLEGPFEEVRDQVLVELEKLLGREPVQE